jgi:hypothetical protein
VEILELDFAMMVVVMKALWYYWVAVIVRYAFQVVPSVALLTHHNV